MASIVELEPRNPKEGRRFNCSIERRQAILGCTNSRFYANEKRGGHPIGIKSVCKILRHEPSCEVSSRRLPLICLFSLRCLRQIFGKFH